MPTDRPTGAPVNLEFRLQELRAERDDARGEVGRLRDGLAEIRRRLVLILDPDTTVPSHDAGMALALLDGLLATHGPAEDGSHVVKPVEDQAAEIGRLRAALSFYGNETNYSARCNYSFLVADEPAPIKVDLGERARRVLRTGGQ